MEAVVDSERAQIAQIQHWRNSWLELAQVVACNAEERSTAWQERHTPERFQDVMPWQLPERLWQHYHRPEIKSVLHNSY